MTPKLHNTVGGADRYHSIVTCIIKARLNKSIPLGNIKNFNDQWQAYCMAGDANRFLSLLVSIIQAS